MEIARLTTIYDADDRTHRRVTDSVVSRERQATREIEKQLRDRQRAADSLVSGLISRLPGSGRINQFRHLADDITQLTKTAEGGAGGVSGLNLAVQALGGSAGVTAIAVGGLIAVTTGALAGVFEGSKAWAEYGDSIFKAMQKTGQSAEQLSVIKFATEELKRSNAGASISFDQVIRGITRYEANVSRGFTNPTRQAAKALDALSLSAAQLRQMSPDEAFRTIMVSLDGVKNRMDRDRAAADLFGRDFQNLIPIMDTLGKHFDETRERAEALGLVFSGRGAAQARIFMQSLKDAELAGKGFAVTFGSEVGPEVTRVLRLLTAETSEVGSVARLTGNLVGGVIREQVNNAITLIALLKTAVEETELLAAGGPTALKSPKDLVFKNVREMVAAMNAPLPGVGQGDHDITFPGKSGESAARRAAKQALELARIDIAEAESVYREGVDIARRAYDLNLNDFKEYVERRKEAELDRYEAVKKGFEAERRAAETLPTAGERRVEIAKIGQRERDELRKHNEANAQLTTEGLLHRLEIERKFAESSARLMEQRQEVADADLARLIRQGTKTHEQAVGERFATLARVAERQGEALRVGLVKALGGPEAAKELSDTISDLIGNAVSAEDAESLKEAYNTIFDKAANKEAAKEALDAVVSFFLQRKRAFQQNNRDTEEAQGEDLRSWLTYVRSLQDILSSVQDAGFDIRQSQVDRLFESNFGRRSAVEAQRALDAARENARSARAVAQLEAEVQRVAREEQNPRRAVETIRAINQQIEAEERQHQQRLIDIDHRAAEERRRQLVEVADDIAGILSSGLEQFDGTWSSLWRGMLDEALSVIRQIAAELMKMSFESLLTGGSRGSSGDGLLGFLSNAIGGALLGGFGGGGRLPGPNVGGGVWSGIPFGGFHAAGGADFTVGGREGVDANFVPMWLSKNERVIVQTPEQQRRGQQTVNHYYITAPAVRERSYVQPRSRREMAETFAAVLKTRV